MKMKRIRDKHLTSIRQEQRLKWKEDWIEGDEKLSPPRKRPRLPLVALSQSDVNVTATRLEPSIADPGLLHPDSIDPSLTDFGLIEPSLVDPDLADPDLFDPGLIDPAPNEASEANETDELGEYLLSIVASSIKRPGDNTEAEGAEVADGDEALDELLKANINLSDAADPLSDPLSLPPMQFVHFYSKNNIVNSQRGHRAIYTSLKDKTPLPASSALDVGFSRDSPTIFIHLCPNREEGCDYTHKDIGALRTHITNCRFGAKVSTSTAPTIDADVNTTTSVALVAEKPFKCPEILPDGAVCNKAYATKKKL